MRNRNLLLALTCLIMLLPQGCSDPVEDTVVLDILENWMFLETFADSGVINISSDRSAFYLASGFSSPYLDEETGDPTIAVILQESVLRYNVSALSDRQFSFQAKRRGLWRGPRLQDVQVLAGETILYSGSIENEWQTHNVEIPATAQKAGVNELIFRFSHYEAHEKYLKNFKRNNRRPFPGIAAYMKDIAFQTETTIPDENYALTAVAGGSALQHKNWTSFDVAFDSTSELALILEGRVEAFGQFDGEASLNFTLITDDISEAAPFHKEQISSEDPQLSARISIPDSSTQAIVRVDLQGPDDNREFSLIYNTAQFVTVAKEETVAAVKPEVESTPTYKHLAIIVIDAARPDFFGCYGDEHGATPFMDSLAAEGILFENAVVSAPYTIASISTLFSGMNPESHGVTTISSKYPESLPNMARSFNNAGFQTLTLAGSQFTQARFGITAPCDEVVYLRDEEDVIADLSRMDEDAIQSGLERAAATGKQAFIFAHFLPPHWPYKPPEPFDSMFIENPEFELWNFRHDFWRIESLFDNGLIDEHHPEVEKLRLTYYNNLRYADYLVEQLVNSLDEHGMLDDTLVIVTSDHGEAFGEHGKPGHNSTVHAEMVNVPLILWGKDMEAQRISHRVGWIDLYPTLNHLFGLGEDTAGFEGRNLYSGETGFNTSGDGVYYQRADNGNTYAIHKGAFKFIFESDRFHALYNLDADPGERQNLVTRHPATAALMRQQLLQYRHRAMQGSITGENVDLTEKDEEELRNLGYVQ